MPGDSTTKLATATNKQKENLNWKINYLAAQLGDKSRIPRANLAAKTLVKDASNLDEDFIRKQLLELKAQKINKKLFHTTREIRKFLKRAKTHELQRLSKKSKETQKLLQGEEAAKEKKVSKDTLETLDQELSLLKKLDLDQMATSATRNKVNKLGSVKHSEIAPMLSFSAEANEKQHHGTEADKSKLLRDLEARLLNFKLIREEFTRLVNDIDTILQAGSQTTSGADNEETAEDNDDDEEENNMDLDDSENLEEDNTEESKVKDTTATKSKRKSSAEAADTKKPKKARAQKTDKPTEPTSAFVGTLYSSGEDSDDEVTTSDKHQKKKKGADEWVDDNFDQYYGAPKKNRAGQRARREKWEKLYGEEARHVKSSMEAEKAREERKLARQLKKSASGGNKTQLGKSRTNASDSAKAESKANAKPRAEQLHPSWEAKKIQQELMAKALSGSAGLGNNKIVFDDSD